MAKLLWDNKDLLDKLQLGNYIAGENDSDVALIREYAKFYNFKDKTIDAAIRSFLQSFILPGEAQKISRIMDNFALSYYEQNSHNKDIPDSECAFVLSFAIIMLNTDAHNPAILPKNKMSREAFVKNLTSTWIDDTDPPRGMIEIIYDEIVNNEIIIIKDGDPKKKGWLKAKFGKFPEGEKFFLLKDNELLWYKSPTLDGNGVPIRGKLKLQNLFVVYPVEEGSSKFDIGTKENYIPYTLFEKGKESIYYCKKMSFIAPNVSSSKQWFEILTKETLHGPITVHHPPKNNAPQNKKMTEKIKKLKKK